MSVLYMNEPMVANHSQNIQMIEDDIANTNELINAINEFNESSITVLKGEAWDLIRNNLVDCAIACLKKQELARLLIEKIKLSNNTLWGYMNEGYAETADDSRLEELRIDLNRAKINYNNLSEKLQLLNKVNNSSFEIISNEESLSQFGPPLSRLSETIQNIDLIIKWLEKLAPLNEKSTREITSSIDFTSIFKIFT